ncbi:MAG TPA: hypothetical protein VKU79_07665 [Thermoplasmataceae archaeon]|nr:hypothetical protein [Thermoplasmataceae archaeon]
MAKNIVLSPTSILYLMLQLNPPDEKVRFELRVLQIGSEGSVKIPIYGGFLEARKHLSAVSSDLPSGLVKSKIRGNTLEGSAEGLNNF